MPQAELLTFPANRSPLLRVVPLGQSLRPPDNECYGWLLPFPWLTLSPGQACEFPCYLSNIQAHPHLRAFCLGFCQEYPYLRAAQLNSLQVFAEVSSAREFQKNIYFCFIDYAKAFDCVGHNTLWKILEEMGIPDHLTCLLRNLYAGQEATVRTGHGTTD